jgi:hypothetical protein
LIIKTEQDPESIPPVPSLQDISMNELVWGGINPYDIDSLDISYYLKEILEHFINYEFLKMNYGEMWSLDTDLENHHKLIPITGGKEYSILDGRFMPMFEDVEDIIGYPGYESLNCSGECTWIISVKNEEDVEHINNAFILLYNYRVRIPPFYITPSFRGNITFYVKIDY